MEDVEPRSEHDASCDPERTAFWSVRASTEGHVIGSFLATTICVMVALAFPHLPRPGFMDWGPHVPFGSSMFVFGLVLAALLTLPIALSSLPVALLAHGYATRLYGHDDAAHVIAAMLVTAFATSSLFALDSGLLNVPWNYVLVNVPIGALGGLAHVRILALHGRKASAHDRPTLGVSARFGSPGRLAGE